MNNAGKKTILKSLNPKNPNSDKKNNN